MASSFNGDTGASNIDEGVGSYNAAIDAADAEAKHAAGDHDDTVQEQGMSPRPSKRGKYNVDEVDGDGSAPNKSSALIKDGDFEKAATARVDLDEKPAAKQAASLGNSNDSKSETSGDDARSLLVSGPNDDDRPVKRKRHDDTPDSDSAKQLPLAPTLHDYLSSGGHGRYSLRPEWFHRSLDDRADAPVHVHLSADNHEFVESTMGALPEALRLARGIAPAGGAGGGAFAGEDNHRVEIHQDDEAGQLANDVPPAAAAAAAAAVAARIGRAMRGLQHGNSVLQRLENNNHMFRYVGGGEPHYAEEGPNNVGVHRDALRALFPPMGNPAPRPFANHAPAAFIAGEAEQQQQQQEEEEDGEVGMPVAGRGNRWENETNVARGGEQHSIGYAANDTAPQGSTTCTAASPVRKSPHEVLSVFGFQHDSALHLAIEQNATEAAVRMIQAGADINFSNAKGITPVMVASQEGSVEIVRALLNKGASPNATTLRGSTALIQACHFGKVLVVEELLKNGAHVDQANLKNTTAMMRASQEGHRDVIRLLLSYNASVNHRNDERMTALMLSSQRGHVSIVKLLIDAGADIDAKTAQESTSLMLACKRKHVAVARILVASGTELKLKDCKNRSVHETAVRKGNTELAKLLTDDAQVALMQQDSRCARNFMMVRTWKLLQAERAVVRLAGIDANIHYVAENMESPILRHACPSKQALVRTMTLPAPLIELISSFIPVPRIWEKRLMLLTSRSRVDPDSAIFNALDLVDEILENGDILEAFDSAGVAPPSTLASWVSFRRCGNLDAMLRKKKRRSFNYLQVMARASPSLDLSSHPYGMPNALFERLTSCHDIQSLIRRPLGRGVHFETNIANDMVVTARMTAMWCESRSIY